MCYITKKQLYPIRVEKYSRLVLTVKGLGTAEAVRGVQLILSGNISPHV